MKRFTLVTAIVAVFLTLAASQAGANAKYIVVVVWDGMRPDLVTKENAPTLFAMMQKGVFFENNHPAFPSSTEVNGAAIATGSYPRTSGIIANREYRPDIDPMKTVATEEITTVRMGDSMSNGGYLKVPTMAEVLRTQVPALKTVCAGTKGVTLLLDRALRDADSSSILICEGDALPSNLAEKLNSDLGLFPAATNNNKTVRDNWTCSAMVDVAWEGGVPPFSMLWLAEPDYSQHQMGVGSDTSMDSIRNCDDRLAYLLASLSKRGILDQTDVIVVSDHGFSTASRRVDLNKDLRAAGIDAVKAFGDKPAPGSALTCSLGTVNFIYLSDHDKAAEARILDVLRKLDYVGAIFTRSGAEGTFPLSDAMIDSPAAPDIVVSFRWTSEKNAAGLRGMIPSESGNYVGVHSSAGPSDMHNTMIAYGPDFRLNWRDTLPTGNVDIAPTVYWILGITPPKSVDGRVLSEAMTIPAPEIKTNTSARKVASVKTPTGTWVQYLKVSEVNGTHYIDEGNGALEPAK